MARKRQNKRKWYFPRCCGEPMKVVASDGYNDVLCLICGKKETCNNNK